MAGEVNPGYSLSDLQNLKQEYIELKNTDGKIIKISVKPFKTKKARETVEKFLGHYYDNGDKGSIKKDGKLQYGELDNLRKDLKRNFFTNEKGELEITEDAIEKITYCIEEKGQKPGIREEFRMFPPRERDLIPEMLPEKNSAWGMMPKAEEPEHAILIGRRYKNMPAEKEQNPIDPAMPREKVQNPDVGSRSAPFSDFPAKKSVNSPDEINFVKILEKFIKEEELKEKGQKLDENITFSPEEIKILKSLMGMPKYKLNFIFKKFTEELERFQP